ncbi:MAG: hypothetical protein Q8P41_29760 [Pseudomonadota bacterium]|nr:hypothetical protein [Pseudomonadota bacterium]
MTLLLLLGCQSIDLSDEWDLDRLRLLAIRAEPAEPRPGDSVTFTSLGYVPGGAAWTSVWFACVAGTDLGCSFDPSVLDGLDDLASMTPEEQAEVFAALQAAGLIGFEPGLAPAWTVPEDALAGLTEAESLEGTSATVQVTLTTAAAEEEGDTELVLRAIPISLAPTPNQNPDVSAFEIDGTALAAGVAFTAEAGRAYDLKATIAGELEEYAYVSTEGVEETRTEELSWRWYTDMGTLGGAVDVDLGEDEEPTSDTIAWTASEEGGTGVLHAVVLDGRGGMAWWSVAVTVE